MFDVLFIYQSNNLTPHSSLLTPQSANSREIIFPEEFNISEFVTIALHNLHKLHIRDANNSLVLLLVRSIYIVNVNQTLSGEKMSVLTKNEINDVLDEHIGAMDEDKILPNFKLSIFSWTWLDNWTQSSYEAWEKSGRTDSF